MSVKPIETSEDYNMVNYDFNSVKGENFNSENYKFNKKLKVVNNMFLMLIISIKIVRQWISIITISQYDKNC